MIAVRYIGRQDYWKAKPSLKLAELDFVSGQVRNVPAPLGRSFLRHSDLFERVEDEAKEPDEDTGESIAEAATKDDEEVTRQQDYFDLLARIDTMGKDALQGIALDQFKVKLDKRFSLDRMREEVRGYIEQYGVS